MNFFPLPNEPATKKRKQRVATVALEREAATYELFTDEELYAAKGGVMIFDLEVYPNYYLAAFQCYHTQKVVYFELSETHTFDKVKLLWVIHNFCLVGFNSNNFDLPILWLSLQPNITTETLKFVVNEIIIGSWRPSDVEKAYKFRMGTINTIDLIEVAPLRGSLKAYMSRLHAKRLQDLPYKPDQTLTVTEMLYVRNYCCNDLVGTTLLLTDLCPQLELRSQLSSEYRLDLRSKSDAQIAEAVLVSEITALNGYYSKRPVIAPGTSYKYNIPEYIQYKTPVLKNMLELVRNADFIVAESGSIEMPQVLNGFTVQIGNSVYRMGIGGLHSSEECVSYQSDDETLLLDRDVASFYPAIILTLGLYPKHLGGNFLNVYRSIVERRLRAKARVKEIKKEIETLEKQLTKLS